MKSNGDAIPDIGLISIRYYVYDLIEKTNSSKIKKRDKIEILSKLANIEQCLSASIKKYEHSFEKQIGAEEE